MLLRGLTTRSIHKHQWWYNLQTDKNLVTPQKSNAACFYTSILLKLSIIIQMCKNQKEGNFITINLTPHLSELVKYWLFYGTSKLPLLKKSSYSFNMVKLMVNEHWCLIGMPDAGMRINDNIDPNWANEVCKWSVTITICSFPYIGKSKELNYIRKIRTWGDEGFKSCTIILSQSVLPIQLTATMEICTFHIWGDIELSNLDQF